MSTELREAPRPLSFEEFRLASTPFGWAAACWTDRGLAAFTFGRATPQDAVRSLDPKCGGDVDEPCLQHLEHWRRLLDVLELSNDDDLLDIPLDLCGYTKFQQAVVEACRHIPRGDTKSYGELAADVGRPRAARAVGTVMAQNRFPLIVPCHRVVAAGSLGGFSAPEGLSLKRRLLEMEGASY